MKRSLYSQTFKHGILGFGLTIAFGGTLLFGEDDFLDEEAFFEEELESAVEVYDPLEPLNRVMFKINDVFYEKLYAPVSDAYVTITPDPIETGVVNFFRNARYPVRLVGNLLQFKTKEALVETKRFAINSTVGVVGIMDLASEVEGLERPHPEDVAQALGAWGVPEGPYLVVPLIGPSNVRDFSGFWADAVIHPFRQSFSLTSNWSWEWGMGLNVTEVNASSPVLIDRYRSLKGGSVDPYSALKNGYTQARRAAVDK